MQNIKYLLLTFFCIGTIYFFNNYPRYEILEPELLNNSNFYKGLQNWFFSDSGVTLEPFSGQIKLQNNEPSNSPILYQTVRKPFPSSPLVLSAEVRTQTVTAGDADWKCARVALIATDSHKNQRFDRPHLLTTLTGTNNWRHYQTAFNVDGDIEDLTVAIQLLQSSGVFWVRGISLRPAKISTTFERIRIGLLGCWVALLIWTATPLILKAGRDRSHAMILILATIILLGVLIPESLKETIGAQLLQIPRAELDRGTGLEIQDYRNFKLPLKLPSLDIYKAGHFIMFAILSSAILLASIFAVNTWRVIIGLFLFAWASEVLQLFVPGRTPQSGDVMLDTLGIGSGVLLFCLKK